MSMSPVIGILRVTLHLPESGSLKSKRFVEAEAPDAQVTDVRTELLRV